MFVGFLLFFDKELINPILMQTVTKVSDFMENNSCGLES